VTEAHTAVDFLAFMKLVVRRYPRQELHVILDNSSTHGTPEVSICSVMGPCGDEIFSVMGPTDLQP
jgi:hypothetical protein